MLTSYRFNYQVERRIRPYVSSTAVEFFFPGFFFSILSSHRKQSAAQSPLFPVVLWLKWLEEIEVLVFVLTIRLFLSQSRLYNHRIITNKPAATSQLAAAPLGKYSDSRRGRISTLHRVKASPEMMQRVEVVLWLLAPQNTKFAECELPATPLTIVHHCHAATADAESGRTDARGRKGHQHVLIPHRRRVSLS